MGFKLIPTTIETKYENMVLNERNKFPQQLTSRNFQTKLNESPLMFSSCASDVAPAVNSFPFLSFPFLSFPCVCVCLQFSASWFPARANSPLREYISHLPRDCWWLILLLCHMFPFLFQFPSLTSIQLSYYKREIK